MSKLRSVWAAWLILQTGWLATGCLQVYNSTSSDTAAFTPETGDGEEDSGTDSTGGGDSGGTGGSGGGGTSGDGGGSTTPDPAAQRFSAAKTVLKNNSCYKCHSEFRAFTEADFSAGNYYLTPGNPASSLLYQRVLGQGSIMPQSPYAQLSAADKAILAEWIQKMSVP